jgi:hypothetical protein
MQQQVIVQFRVRVYQLPDGTIEVFIGDGHLPIDPSWVLLKDQDVVETKVMTDHVEPAVEPA